jgi:PIN domain nuclease of toxin-antitoxin system
MAVKLRLGKLRLDEPIDTFVPQQLSANRFSLLEINFRHVARVAKLPFGHRDPFDRLLVAQALEEQVPIVTSDPAFAHYGAKRIW